MNRLIATITAVAVLGTASLSVLAPHHLAAIAQPAKGAGPAFERVREVMNNRFKDMKLTGDPDKDFATILIAHHEDLIFLAKTHLEYGGDRQLRQLAQKLLDEQQKQIDEVKQWQIRSRQPDYQAQPNQSPPGSGPLVDQKGQAVAAAPAQAGPGGSAATPSTASATAAPAANLPMVSATVEKVDTAGGKITLDHAPIPNLNMDAMTMVFRAQDPALLNGVRPGDKVQFQADRVNGQISIVKIQTGRGAPATAQAAAQPAAATANLPTVSGTVEKVDTAQSKITIDHAPIPNLNMDAMTMVFRAQGPAMLKGVKAGDRIQFQADRANGQISVVKIQKGR